MENQQVEEIESKKYYLVEENDLLDMFNDQLLLIAMQCDKRTAAYMPKSYGQIDLEELLEYYDLAE